MKSKIVTHKNIKLLNTELIKAQADGYRKNAHLKSTRGETLLRWDE